MRRPEALAVLAGLLGLGLGWGPALAIAQEPDYLQLVERYARGEREAAVAALRGWDERGLERGLERVARAGKGRDTAWLRAAMMLHADADQAERPALSGVEQAHLCAGFHAVVAGRYARQLAWFGERRDFARRFFLAMAYRYQWDGCLDDAGRWGLDGLEYFPNDAELLLAVGSVHEEAATLGVGPAAERERERRFKEARRYYSEALAANQGLAMARVRLGRVHWRLGESEAARTTLEETLTGTQDPGLLFLAHLFLGQVYEDADRLEPAVAQYRLALEAHPGAQAAAVALSHALRLAGDASGSRAVLARQLAEAGRRGRVRDHEYWNYLSLQALPREQLFAELREEALR